MKRLIMIMLCFMLLCGCVAVNEDDNVTNGQAVSESGNADDGQEIAESNDMNNNQTVTDGDSTDNSPIDTDSVRKVEVLYENAFIITGSGELWAWGSNGTGQLCYDYNKPGTNIPQKLLTGVVDSGLDGTCWAIKENGELWTWSGDIDNRTLTPTKIMNEIKSFKSGTGDIALKNDGEVWTWGSNDSGQLGDGTFVSRSTPKKIMDNVKSIDIYVDTVYAVKEDGSLWFWGNNSADNFIDDLPEEVSEPIKIMEGVSKVIAYDMHSIYFIKDNGELWGWSFGFAPELGTDVKVSGPIKILDGVKDVAHTSYGCIALKENGECWLWGKTTVAKEQKIEKPQKVLNGVAQICMDEDRPLLLRNNGELWQCAILYLSDGTGNNEIIVKKLMDDIRLASGDHETTIAVTNDNKILIWRNWVNNSGDDWEEIWDGTEINPKEIVLDGKTEVPY